MPRKKVVPPPATAATAAPDPGGRGSTDATWVKRDLDFKAASPVHDYSSGSEAGINNGS